MHGYTEKPCLKKKKKKKKRKKIQIILKKHITSLTYFYKLSDWIKNYGLCTCGSYPLKIIF
jgi:hypothetical protein